MRSHTGHTSRSRWSSSRARTRTSRSSCGSSPGVRPLSSVGTTVSLVWERLRVGEAAARGERRANVRDARGPRRARPRTRAVLLSLERTSAGAREELVPVGRSCADRISWAASVAGSGRKGVALPGYGGRRAAGMSREPSSHSCGLSTSTALGRLDAHSRFSTVYHLCHFTAHLPTPRLSLPLLTFSPSLMPPPTLPPTSPQAPPRLR